MKSGCHGVWVTFRSSTIIALYDSFVFLKLMEVDYTSLCPSLTIAYDADVSYMYLVTLYMHTDVMYTIVE